MKGRKTRDFVIVKPVWWRQSCLTLFLLLSAIFCSFVGNFGPLVGWLLTSLMAVISLLSLLDQVFEWSRLRIDRRGFSLRTWLRNQSLAHSEVEDFEIIQFAGRKLMVAHLKEPARRRLKSGDQPFPFSCCFGRPPEEVLSILRSHLDRTPRPS